MAEEAQLTLLFSVVASQCRLKDVRILCQMTAVLV